MYHILSVSFILVICKYSFLLQNMQIKNHIKEVLFSVFLSEQCLLRRASTQPAWPNQFGVHPQLCLCVYCREPLFLSKLITVHIQVGPFASLSACAEPGLNGTGFPCLGPELLVLSQQHPPVPVLTSLLNCPSLPIWSQLRPSKQSQSVSEA